MFALFHDQCIRLEAEYILDDVDFADQVLSLDLEKQDCLVAEVDVDFASREFRESRAMAVEAFDVDVDAVAFDQILHDAHGCGSAQNPEGAAIGFEDRAEIAIRANRGGSAIDKIDQREIQCLASLQRGRGRAAMDVGFAIDQGGEAVLGVEYGVIDAQFGVLVFGDQLDDGVAQPDCQPRRFAAIVQIGERRCRAAHAQFYHAAFQNIVERICLRGRCKAQGQTCG